MMKLSCQGEVKMRKAFSIIHVILIIVIMSGILALTLRYANITVRHTSDSYLTEEAELFLRSTVELSLYTLSSYPRVANNNCLETININSPIDGTGSSRFIATINVSDYYLLNGSADFNICNKAGVGYTLHGITTEDSHGMVMLEIIVRSNPAHPKNSRHNVRIVRKTLQKV